LDVYGREIPLEGIVLIVAVALILYSAEAIYAGNQTLAAATAYSKPENIIAEVGAATGAISLFILWYRGRPRLSVEIASADHTNVSASNLSGTQLSMNVIIKNQSDSPTTIYKAAMEIKGTSLSEVFELGSSSRSFPYVGRGVIVLGHDVVAIPLVFNFTSELSARQGCCLKLWHTHGTMQIPMTSVLKQENRTSDGSSR
jgi:hypothetical protein